MYVIITVKYNIPNYHDSQAQNMFSLMCNYTLYICQIIILEHIKHLFHIIT